MPYVEHIDRDVGGSSNGLWVVLGVAIVILVFLVMLAWGGIFGPQVQQVVPFYSGQTTPAPVQVVPGPTGATGQTGAPGAPAAPPASLSSTTSP